MDISSVKSLPLDPLKENANCEELCEVLRSLVPSNVQHKVSVDIILNLLTNENLVLDETARSLARLFP